MRAVTSCVERPGWGNRYEGSNGILDRGAKRADVQARGRDRARKAQVAHIIQQRDGTIGEPVGGHETSSGVWRRGRRPG